MTSLLTLGIDLAAQPAKTAACLVDWSDGPGRVVLVEHGPLLNAELAALARRDGVVKVAIDAPFGWPVAFAAAVAAHADSGMWPEPWDEKHFVLRRTDLVVQEVTLQRPLSVSASLLAVPAMRCAALLAELQGPDVDRTGAGHVVEAYPAAALRKWSELDASGQLQLPGSYKGFKADRRARREGLVGELDAALSGAVALTEADRHRMAASDDELDAFVCALVGRAAYLNTTSRPADSDLAAARAEGWIALPDKPLTALL